MRQIRSPKVDDCSSLAIYPGGALFDGFREGKSFSRPTSIRAGAFDLDRVFSSTDLAECFQFIDLKKGICHIVE